MSPVTVFDEDLSENEQEYYGLGYLDFADSRYLITKSSVIIGRPGDDHLALGEVSDGSDGRANGNESSKKRKRAEDDEDEEMLDSSGENDDARKSNSLAFQGGLGGPQEHAFQFYDDHDTSYIYVWPPANKETGLARNVKAISKRHLRLTLTNDNEWLLDVLGRNGVVVNRDFHPCGSRAWLDHGDTLWFAGVQCQFNVPEPNEDETPYSEDEKDFMSAAGYDLSMEDVNDILSRSEAGEEDELDEDDEDEDDDEEDDDDEDEDDDDEEDEDEEDEDQSSDVPVQKPMSKIKLTTKTKQPQIDSSRPKKRGPYKKRAKIPPPESGDEMDDNSSDAAPKSGKSAKHKAQNRGRKLKTKNQDDELADDDDEPIKKRGPGRPPKDGVMSKRARRALEKAAELDQPEGAATTPKRKTKPRKSSDVNGEEVKASTRKIKKFAKDSVEDTNDKTEETDAANAKPKEEAAPPPPPPPREPSPKETDFTEEQLMKPDRPYSVCLYKVLSESSRALALPEIYEEFKKRWPYYRFRVSGEGWQSSIRHNLQSTKCVVQAGRHGKGHLWTVDPNIPLDHRTTNRINPPNFTQTYYSNAGKVSAQAFQGQNPQLNAMRPPNMAGFPNQQAMTGYQAAYSQSPNYNYAQRQPPTGQQAGSNPQSGATVQQQASLQNQRYVTQFANTTGPGPAANSSSRPGLSSTQQSTNTAGTTSQPPTVNNGQTPINRPAPSITNAGRTQANGVSSSVPAAAGSLVMDDALMKERLHVFDQFRNRLLGMAQNDGQRRYYVEILDQGQQWCSKNTQIGATYDGPRTDIGQIVKAFQEAWEGHLRKKGLLKDQPAAASASSNSSSAFASNSAAAAAAMPKANSGANTLAATSNSASNANSTQLNGSPAQAGMKATASAGTPAKGGESTKTQAP